MHPLARWTTLLVLASIAAPGLAPASTFDVSVGHPGGTEGATGAGPVSLHRHYSQVLHDGCCSPNPGGGPDPVHDNHSYSPVVPNPPGSHVSTPSTIDVDVFAQSGPGYLRTRPMVDFDTPDRLSLGSFNPGGTSSASFTLDDLVISGPGPGPVAAELVLEVTATLVTTISPYFAGPFYPTSTNCDMTIAGSYSGSGAGGGFAGGVSRSRNESGGESYGESGILTGWGAGGPVVHTGQFMLPVNQPFSLHLSLTTNGSVYFSIGGSGACCPANQLARGGTNAVPGVRFRSGGPVFILPPGYTANSPDGRIVDNQADPPVAAPEALAPLALQLSAAPNPASGGTALRFALERAAGGSLVIHDLAGRRVRVLAHGMFEAGEHRIPWDGRDERGRALASGLYLARLEAGGRSSVKKVWLAN